MNFKVGFWVVFIFVVLLSFGLFFSRFELTSNVIWQPNEVTNCDNFEILTVWDNIFLENSSDVVILKPSSGDCNGYVAYKTNSDGLILFIFNYLTNYSGQIERLSGAYYINGSEVLVNEVNSHNVYEGFNTISYFTELWSNFDEINNRNLTEGSADGVFRINPDFFKENEDYFLFTEENVFDNGNKTLEVRYYKFKSISFFKYYSINTSGFSDPIIKIKNIPDFVFDINTNWSLAFNILNYFTSNYDLNYSFVFTGENNSNGSLIDYDLDGDTVLFKPSKNYTGSLNFQIRVENDYGYENSNLFSVNISDINTAPQLIKHIGFIFVPINGVAKVDLSLYFIDNDSDDLTYRIEGGDTLNISFNEFIMSIGVFDDFNGSDKFKVFVSDGIKEKSSGTIWVYMEDNIDNLVNNFNKSNNLSTITNRNYVNNNSNIKNSNIKKDGLGWVFWFILVIIFLSIVLVLIYFFILKRSSGDNFNNNSISPNNNEFINNYMQNLGINQQNQTITQTQANSVNNQVIDLNQKNTSKQTQPIAEIQKKENQNNNKNYNSGL